jgi:hypothetical protein
LFAQIKLRFQRPELTPLTTTSAQGHDERGLAAGHQAEEGIQHQLRSQPAGCSSRCVDSCVRPGIIFDAYASAVTAAKVRLIPRLA